MRVKTVTDGQNISEWYTIPNDMNRSLLRIGLLGWYPVYKSETSYPSQYYNIILLTKEKTKIRLAKIFFNPLMNKSSEWQKINTQKVTLIKIPENVISFKIISEAAPRQDNEPIPETTDEHKKHFFKEWKYHFVLVQKGENINIGTIEDMAFTPENVTKSYCQKSSTSSTNSSKQIIGAVCPINPLTGKEMEECLVWRRLDDIGRECREKNILTDDEIEKSIYNFCNEKPSREDCRCINRELSDEYKKEKPLHSENDYCWFQPCSSGYYLVKNAKTPVQCNSQNCNVIYQIYGTGGSVNFDKNDTRQQCFNIEKTNNNTEIQNPIDNTPNDDKPPVVSKPTDNILLRPIVQQKPIKQKVNNKNFSFDKKYVFMMLGSILVLFMLIFLKR